MKSTEPENQQQVLEPVEQEAIAFHGEQIIAARLADGRICVVLRWICASLSMDPQAQVRRIQRTAAIAGELLRVRVQTEGGRQTMPALTLRGFPTWIVGINPNEIKDDPQHPEEAKRIRQMIIAYQVEAVDVLYQHFAAKAQNAAVLLPSQAQQSPAISAHSLAPMVIVQPQEPGPEATSAELASYYEDVVVWASWKAKQYTQAWRNEIEEWRGAIEARQESQEAMSSLLPEILERFGPQTITSEHQAALRGMVKRLAELGAEQYQTIYWQLAQTFQVPRYTELLESQYPAVQEWFKQRIEAAKKPRR